MPRKRKQIHYVASTHWDREWYLPFQGFRYKLVKLVDQLLDLLEKDPEYRFFVFDGQTAAILDYLEIMPENKPRIEALVRGGRILAGPWHTMPDERIISGEAIIRNLARGYADARSLGADPMRYGFICDIFGHIAQMPQIFAGVGISQAFLWRGANDATHPALFRWRAPDGSEVVTWRPSDDGSYSSGKPVWEAANAPAPGSKEWRDGVIKAAACVQKLEGSRSKVPVTLWFDGQDHQLPCAHIPAALEVIRRAMPDYDVIFSNLNLFARAVEPYCAGLPAFEGELLAPAKDASLWLAVIPHCPSSYYPMKQLNDRCQTLLEYWAEPFLVWAKIETKVPSANFLDHAWQFLLQNHPHDSICGCSIDQVHKDTEYRYDQSAIIAENVIKECQENLAVVMNPAATGTSDKDRSGLTVSIFSSSPMKRRQVTTIEFDYPADMPARMMHGFPDDQIPCFDILDSSGRRLDYQLHSYVKEAQLQHPAFIFNKGLRAYYSIRASIETTLDGMGITGLHIVPREKPYRLMDSQITGPCEAENQDIALRIQENGAVTIRDKKTGIAYKDLCVFEDTAEMGDGWYHVRPVNNQTFLSTGFPAGISVLADGPFLTTFRIEKTMMLPSSFSWMERRRSQDRIPLNLITDVTLRKGERRVEFRVSMENTIKDHRLRVLFPTGIRGMDWFAGQQFTVVRRARGADRSTFDWQESDVPEKSFLSIAGVDSAKSGLAIIAGHGLHEAAVSDDRSATIALTLMRGFKRTVRGADPAFHTPMDARSQLLGRMTFNWQVATFQGRADFCVLLNMAREFQAGTMVRAHRGNPVDRTFLNSRNGSVMVSAFKPAQDRDGAILRVFNPTDSIAEDVLEFAAPFSSAIEVNHVEEPVPGVRKERGGRRLKISLPAQKIRTYRLRFRNRIVSS